MPTVTRGTRGERNNVERRELCGDLHLEAHAAGGISPTSKSRRPFARDKLLSVLRSNTSAPKKLASCAWQSGERKHTVLTFKESRPLLRNNAFKEGRITITEAWKPEKLWDIHTPQKMYMRRALG